MRTVQSAGFILFLRHNNENLYLLLQYRGGHWDFPKGKIDAQETKEEAAIRELKEETGLDATILPGFQESFSYTFTDYDYKKTHKTVFFFIAQATSKIIQLSDEHIGYAWLSYEHALEKLTYENAKAVLTHAHEHLQKLPTPPPSH